MKPIIKIFYCLSIKQGNFIAIDIVILKINSSNLIEGQGQVIGQMATLTWYMYITTNLSYTRFKPFVKKPP